jgi:hypothetical protein
VVRLLGGRYPSVVAPTGSCATPVELSLPSAFSLVPRVLAGPAIELREHLRSKLMQVIYKLVPVIADVISAHCSGKHAREDFVRARVHGHWDDAAEIIEGMLSNRGI